MELPVMVEKIVFRSEKGFAILACSLNPYSSKYKPELEDLLLKNIKPNKYNNFAITIAKMDYHEKAEGRQYIFVGDFIKHEKYGEQFKAEFYFSDAPTNEEGLRAYLMEFPNIKESRSASIIKRFGYDGTIRVLDEDPNRLTEINGITEARVAPIKQKWDSEKNKRSLYFWLIDHGISPDIGSRIYEIWRDNSLKILAENPYRLTEIKGFGFIKADFIAHKIFKSVPKDFRMTSCMRYILEDNLYKNSNLCMPYGLFHKVVLETLQKGSEANDPQNKFNIKEYAKLLPECIKKNLDTFVAVKDITETTNGSYIYLKEIWNKEKYIANSLYHRRPTEKSDSEDIDPANKAEDQFSCSDKDIEDAEKDICEFSNRDIKLDEDQKNAVKSAFENKVTIITGGGGTGKSTICRCIFHLAEEKRLSVRMMSPTGKAAQVLSEKTGFPAQTIHRSLKLKPGDDFPREQIKEDIVIVDEVSMVGIDTMFAVMNAIEENLWAHIIFVGDANQLPSVSPGNFLKDMMESGCINIVRLTKIHRQDENSYIPLLANDIAKGKVVEIPENATDVKWHHLGSESFEVTIRQIVRDFMKSNSIDDLQIMSAMYKGEYGVNKINEIMQELMADINGVKSNGFTRRFVLYYVGDRVIQTENNYDKEIFNGDIGNITEAGRKAFDPSVSDEQKDYIIVNFNGEHVTFIEDEIDTLKLAWCITVHKFQGSQSPFILYVMPSEASIMFTKELLYTAMTRTEKKLDIYGHLSMFRLAPTKSAVKKRYTNMNNIIRELRENRKILNVLE